MQSLVSPSFPVAVVSRCTPDAIATMRGLCVRGGFYDRAQVARVFVAAARLSYDTTITAEDVARAWEEVGIRESVIPHVVFHGIRN